MGLGKDFCKIRAYESQIHKKKKSAAKFEEEEMVEFEDEVQIVQDRDGSVYVQIRHDGVYLKVIPPLGSGRKATVEDASFIFARKNILDYDRPLVTELLKKPLSKYIQIGAHKHITMNDSIVTVEIEDQEMTAYMTVTRPGEGGVDLSFEEYIKIINNNGVTFGIKEK